MEATSRLYPVNRRICSTTPSKHMCMSLHMEVIEFLNPSNKRDYEDLVTITDKLISIAE